MKRYRIFFLSTVTFLFVSCFSQPSKPVYHPCFLMDSVEKNLTFILSHLPKIFVDTFECRQALLENIAAEYNKTKDKKFLDALTRVRQFPNTEVEGFYPDIIKRLIESDFSGFLNQLYTAQGKYLLLEKELIATMNMIIGGKLYKQRWLDMLNLEIEKAVQAKNKAKEVYLQKLKTKIEEEKY